MIYGKEIMVIVVSYLLGCISTGYYLTLFRTGNDIRDLYSKTAGAKNAGRILGIAALPLISVLLKQPIVNTMGLMVLVFIILLAHRENIRQTIHSTNFIASKKRSW